MDIKTFKKTLNESLTKLEFSKHGKYYQLDHKDLICVVGIQKSNYSTAYYINIGFLLKSLNPALTHPRDIDGDIRARFSYFNGSKQTDLFDLDQMKEIDFKNVIQKNFDDFIRPASSIEGLRSVLVEYPVFLYQTKLPAKKILGFIT